MKSCNIFIKAGVNRQSPDYCLTYLGGFISLGPTTLTRFFHNLAYFSYGYNIIYYGPIWHDISGLFLKNSIVK